MGSLQSPENEKCVLRLSDSASGDVCPLHEVREVQKKLILANSDEDCTQIPHTVEVCV